MEGAHPLMLVPLAHEFLTGDYKIDEFAERWLGLVSSLLQSPLKDADRAGERLQVFSNTAAESHERHWRFDLRVVGAASGVEYAALSCRLDGELLHQDGLAELELHLTAALNVALNGPNYTDADERAALSEALDGGLVGCSGCERRFLFLEDVYAHAPSCAGAAPV